MHTLYIATHNDSGDNFNCSPRKIRSHLFDFSQRKDRHYWLYERVEKLLLFLQVAQKLECSSLAEGCRSSSCFCFWLVLISAFVTLCLFPSAVAAHQGERASADIYFLMRRKWSLFKQIATLLGEEITHFSRRHVTRGRERDNFWMYAWFEFHVTTIYQLLKSYSMVMIF